MATRKGYTEIVRELLKNGADVNQKNKEGESVLHLATRKGYTEIVKALLEKSPMVDEKIDDHTALAMAVEEGHTEIVGLLVDAKADRTVVVDGKDLWAIAEEKHFEKIVGLLGNKEEALRLSNEAIEKWNTGLMQAIDREDCQSVRDLIDKLKGKVYLVPAFAMAVRKNNYAIVLEFIKADVPVNAVLQPDSGKTALHVAAAAGNREVVTILLERGAEINRQDSTGETALHVAAAADKSEVVKVLLKHNAARDLQDEQKRTPFQTAVIYGSAEASMKLAQAEIVNTPIYAGDTPLFYAARQGQKGVIKYFLGLGADIDHQNRDGDTPLHYAVRYGHKETVEFLIERGAKVDIKNQSGETASETAQRTDMAELFQQKKAPGNP